MKWYMVCARLSLLTGGSTPNASHAKSMTFFGCGPTHGNFALGMYSMGYAARVFSATRTTVLDNLPGVPYSTYLIFFQPFNH